MRVARQPSPSRPPWTLAAGESISFDVTAANSTLFSCTRGTYAGIKQLTFNGSVASASTGDAIPEPATATLSLLALAGLAARRRRK